MNERQLSRWEELPDTMRGERLSRRQFLGAAGAMAGVAAVGSLLSACGPTRAETAASASGATPSSPNASGPAPKAPISGPEREAPSYVLPNQDGGWTPPASHEGRVPTGADTLLRIDGVGEFSFDASQVRTLRPDVFQPGHFSLFDVLAHLAEREGFAMEYHFDEAVDTHIIDSIDGRGGWWYKAHYSGGWDEQNVFRMDQYPYKDGTQVQLTREKEDRLADIYRTFREEVARLESNSGQVILPRVTIESPYFEGNGYRTFNDVAVVAHDVRIDVLQPGVVTGLDVLLSLAEQGELARLRLTWYERIGIADPVESYWVEQIDEAEFYKGPGFVTESYESCGFVYETGPEEFPGFSGSHIHIPSDVRAIVSPEYAFWFWICL